MTEDFEHKYFFSQAPQLMLLLLCFMFPLQIRPQTTFNNFDQMEKQRVYQYSCFKIFLTWFLGIHPKFPRHCQFQQPDGPSSTNYLLTRIRKELVEINLFSTGTLKLWACLHPSNCSNVSLFFISSQCKGMSFSVVPPDR